MVFEVKRGAGTSEEAREKRGKQLAKKLGLGHPTAFLRLGRR